MSSEPEGSVRVVCLSGSTRFKREFLSAQLAESVRGRIVLLPVFSQADGLRLSDPEITALTEVHMRKIELADEVLVIDVGGYIGEQTAREIARAEELEKPIRYWSQESIVDDSTSAVDDGATSRP